VKARTRQFARRQETWFRSLSECTLVPMHEPIDAAAVAESIAAMRTATTPFRVIR
jgi:tRNA dimethylallyltransferase